MNRRKALTISAGALLAGGAGVVTLTSAFKPENPPVLTPKKIGPDATETAWKYTRLDPVTTAELAYQSYSGGSCMYGVCTSIISQLGEHYGEPYSSFPVHMMKYGHGGVGGSGTICGALNGAAAVMGLLNNNKKTTDALIAELFHWYESSEFPLFEPEVPVSDFTPEATVSESVLCHASTTRWGKQTGYRIDSDERKERCRRLTADVAAKTVEVLNSYFDSTFVSNTNYNETLNGCMACHGSKGKMANTSGKMSCNSCHDKSLGHRLFGDIHYKLMKEGN